MHDSQKNDPTTLPVAWCPDLNQTVNAYDVPYLQKQHPDLNLTFCCLSCKQPLVFFLHHKGIQALAGFVQKEIPPYDLAFYGVPMGHNACLNKILKQDHFLEETFVFKEFENTFFQADTLAQETGRVLVTLQERFLPLQQSVFLCRAQRTQQDSDPSQQYLLETLENALETVQKSVDFLNREITDVSKAYKALRRTTKGF